MIAFVAAAPVAACKSQFDPPRPDWHMPTRAEVLEAAQNYYVAGPERPPKDTVDRNYPPGHSVPDTAAPIMSIATMMPIQVPISVPLKILAQITSNRDYQPMGIRQGRNILWRDWMGRAWITAQNGSHQPLQYVPGYVFPLVPGHEPSLYRVQTNSISFLACLDDCPSGHCGMF
jgi:hypothetical protein